MNKKSVTTVTPVTAVTTARGARSLPASVSSLALPSSPIAVRSNCRGGK